MAIPNHCLAPIEESLMKQKSYMILLPIALLVIALLTSVTTFTVTAGKPPGTILTRNPSTTEKIKFLAVVIAKDGSKLTNFEVKH